MSAEDDIHIKINIGKDLSPQLFHELSKFNGRRRGARLKTLALSGLIHEAALDGGVSLSSIFRGGKTLHKLTESTPEGAASRPQETPKKAVAKPPKKASASTQKAAQIAAPEPAVRQPEKLPNSTEPAPAEPPVAAVTNFGESPLAGAAGLPSFD